MTFHIDNIAIELPESSSVPVFVLSLSASANTAPVNQPITVSATLNMPDGNVAPITDLFLVPILNAAGAEALIKGVSFVSGIASVSLSISASGRYHINEAAINSRLVGMRIAMPTPLEVTVYE